MKVHLSGGKYGGGIAPVAASSALPATSTASAPDVETTPLLPQSESSYSAFSHAQKQLIILTAAFAATFSPFSSNIYYPAINSIGHDLCIGAREVNLTITAYMICQGLAPAFIGNLSDTAGRRPVYALCFGIYIAANVGLALQTDYVALLCLRALQSTGISTTVALSNAVAADTVTSAERGMYIGLASLGGVLGPATGPMLGGFLSYKFGWRSIFWFLAASASVCLIMILLFFPETCRTIVGDGSRPPSLWNRSVLQCLGSGRRHGDRAPKLDNGKQSQPKRHIGVPNPWPALRLLFQMPTGLMLLCNAVGYAAYYTVTSTIPSQWTEIYHLNDFQLGLTYLPIGLGTILSGFTTGWLADWNFRRIARQSGHPQIRDGKQDLQGFPIVRARLQIAFPMALVAAASIGAYGWVIDAERPIREALAMLFLIGHAVTASYNSMNVLIVDLNYGEPATATAANNLMRCFFGAGATAAVTPLLQILGRGWCFTLVGTIWALFIPLCAVMQHVGAVNGKGSEY